MMLLIPAVLVLCGLVCSWNLAVTALAEKIVNTLEARRATPAPARLKLAVAK